VLNGLANMLAARKAIVSTMTDDRVTECVAKNKSRGAARSAPASRRPRRSDDDFWAAEVELVVSIMMPIDKLQALCDSNARADSEQKSAFP
jgi:hypothetical protein